VYQDVDLAEFLYSLLDSFSTKRLLTDISCDQQTSTAMFLHQTPGLVRVLFFFEVNGRDLGALFCKGNRNCAANPAVAASDDRNLVPQFSTAPMFFVLCSRSRLHFVFATRLLVLVLSWLKFL